MKTRFCGMALTLTAVVFGFRAAAAGVSPATGDRGTGPLPYVLGAIGLVAVVALIVVTLMDQKKKNSGQTPPDASAEEPTQAAENAAVRVDEAAPADAATDISVGELSAEEAAPDVSADGGNPPQN